MKDENEFKAWLEQDGAQTEAGRNSRTYAVRTIERNLAALGMPYQNLEEAWEADQFAGLRDRLKAIRDNARSGGEDYRILMPNSEKPHNRLSNWSSWLAQYGRFIAGEPPGAAKDADRIRQHVLEQYIEPAREEGTSHVNVLVRDVNTALDLNQAWPNICQALAGKIFQDLAQISAPERIGADQSPATVFRFSLVDSIEAKPQRALTLFDIEGTEYRPAKNFDRSTGISSFHYMQQVGSDGGDGVIKTEDIVELARATIIEGLPARVKLLPRGKVSFLTYGENGPLVRYELDPDIANKIGVPANGGVQETTKQVENTMAIAQQDERPTATNLILYGPPGTGKTYCTAAEAVRLCGEEVPEDRDDLMTVYQGLLAAGQIEFVTFHQSMAYEEFVEGRQPMTGADDSEDTSLAGFRLETVPGIFRRIARRAETNGGKGSFEIETTVSDALSETTQRITLPRGHPEKLYKIGEFPPVQSGSYRQFAQDVASQLANDFPAGFKLAQFKQALIDEAASNGSPEPEGGWENHNMANWMSHPSQAWLVPVEDSGESGGPNSMSAPRHFVLIIDEINRANISKVFGELITLLEPDKRLGQPNQLTVRLPYSGDEFGVPSNLHIVGTMNTADRSIALLDTALRRRFTFREIMPNPAVLKEAAARTGIDLPTLLTILNERIEYLYDRDHQIGHAYFIGCDTRADVDEVMRHKVIPLLAEYFFEDWGKIAAVLGDLDAHDGLIEGGFLNRSVLKAPPGLDNGEAMPRFRWDVREVSFDYARLLGS